MDNIHVNRVASLCLALIELMKYGSKYASQVIRNSQMLAKSLAELGVQVKCQKYGFTKSHQVLLDYDVGKSKRIADFLEECDIITDEGVRLGTSEVTRRGMKEHEMERIASMIAKAINSSSANYALARSVKGEVHKLVNEFQSIEYSMYSEL